MEQIAGVTKVLSLVNAPYIKGDDGLLAVGTVWEQKRPWERNSNTTHVPQTTQ